MYKEVIGALALASILGVNPAVAADRFARPVPAAQVAKFPAVYAVTGLGDDGSADNTGVASTIHCSNPSNFIANVQFIIYNFNGTLKTNKTFTLSKLQTFTASTHFTALYDEDTSLASGTLNEALLQIRSDNSGILCAAEVIDASPKKSFAVTLTARSVNGGG